MNSYKKGLELEEVKHIVDSEVYASKSIVLQKLQTTKVVLMGEVKATKQSVERVAKDADLKINTVENTTNRSIKNVDVKVAENINKTKHLEGYATYLEMKQMFLNSKIDKETIKTNGNIAQIKVENNMSITAMKDDVNKTLTTFRSDVDENLSIMLDRLNVLKKDLNESKIYTSEQLFELEKVVEHIELELSDIYERLEKTEYSTLGWLVWSTPDVDRGVYPIDGADIEDEVLCEYLRDNPIMGFNTADCPVIHTPDWRGYYLGYGGAKTLSARNGTLQDDKTAPNGLYLKGTTVTNEDNDRTHYLVSHGDWTATFVGYLQGMWIAGDEETRPNTVSFTLCIKGTNGK